MTLAGTSFAKIIPDRSKKVPVGTIKGISNYFTFMWQSGVEDGYIAAYEIPNYGKSKKYSIFDIKKLLKIIILINQTLQSLIKQHLNQNGKCLFLQKLTHQFKNCLFLK